MKKNKILIIAAQFYPLNGGYSNATQNFINSIKMYEKEVEFDVFTFQQKDFNIDEFKNCKNVFRKKYLKIPLTSIFSQFKNYFFFKKLIHKNEYSLVMFETAELGFLGYLLSKKFPNKISVRIHACQETEVAFFKNDFYCKILKLFIKLFLKNVNYIFSTTGYYLEFINKYYFKENPFLIYNKKYFELFNPYFLDDSIILKVNNNYGQYLFSLGRLNENGLLQKGFEDIIFAVYFLEINNLVPKEFKIILVGDGEERLKLIQLVEKLKLKNYFIFIKKTNHTETLEYISNSKGILLASRFEGQSMFATEALALGKPLIFSNAGGLNGLINKKSNGFIFNKGNYSDLANKILKFYNLSEKEIQKLGVNSQELFNKKYNPKAIYKQFKIIHNYFINK